MKMTQQEYLKAYVAAQTGGPHRGMVNGVRVGVPTSTLTPLPVNATEKVYDFIVNNGPCLIGVIANEFGTKSSHLSWEMTKLEDRGYIKSRKRRGVNGRLYSVTNKPRGNFGKRKGNEGRAIILRELLKFIAASKPMTLRQMAEARGVKLTTMSSYLATLTTARCVEKGEPVAGAGSRGPYTRVATGKAYE